MKKEIPTPTYDEVMIYLNQWDNLENYVLQEKALDRLFLKLAPDNTVIEDVLIKCSTLNDFYSTNIFSIYPVAKHIVNLNIDERLRNGDVSLVGDIKDVIINGSKKSFYSFATKYCSHHNTMDYPIYDSYVHKVLIHFLKKDNFSRIKNDDLKDYNKFKETLIQFRKHYNLEAFNLKQLDQYLWLLGKEYFKKNY